MQAGINKITIKDNPRLLPPGRGTLTKSPHKNPVIASITDTRIAILSSLSLTSLSRNPHSFRSSLVLHFFGIAFLQHLPWFAFALLCVYAFMR